MAGDAAAKLRQRCEAAGLSPEQTAAVVEVEGGGRSWEESAASLGIRVASLGMRLTRGRQLLRQWVAAQEKDAEALGSDVEKALLLKECVEGGVDHGDPDYVCSASDPSPERWDGYPSFADYLKVVKERSGTG